MLRSLYRVGTTIGLLCYLSNIGVGAADIKLMRKNNLDYLDIATMEHFLDPDVRTDYNVAVLFYAQWDRNSHAFAPLWDKMSRQIRAGTKDSRIIMGLFDCEASVAASKLCSKAGVTHYPGVFYISMSGQRFNGKKDASHVTKFPGNWQYGDAVVDWIRTLQGLDSWHRSGWGQRLRNLLSSKKKPIEMLPLGIPGQSGEGGSGASPAALARIEQEVDGLKEQSQSLSNLVIRSGSMLDALLFPVTAKNTTKHTSYDAVSGKNVTDMFSLIHDRWESTELRDLVLKTCVGETTLDYCQRLGTHITEEWMNSYPSLEDISVSDIDEFSEGLPSNIIKQEPYCGIIEDCVRKDFVNETCRPASCPFTDPTACRYLSACLSDVVYQEYEDALTKLNETNTSATPETKKEVPATEEPPKKRGWGI